jgi:DNA repair protein RadC
MTQEPIDPTKPKKPHQHGHWNRLRQRFERGGAAALLDYELLELLLTFAVANGDLKQRSKDLISRFKSLRGVLDADPAELRKIAGIGNKSAILIRLIKALMLAYLEEQMQKLDVLSSPQAVLDFARTKLAGLPHEAFMVIYLDVKNHVLDHEVLHEGTVDRAIVYPRRVIEAAIKHNAVGLILSHNHPSGDPAPSQEDKHLTRAVTEAARTIEIRVLDHVIVGRNGYFSFQENRLLS